jgi:hypothetical protein
MVSAAYVLQYKCCSRRVPAPLRNGNEGTFACQDTGAYCDQSCANTRKTVATD